MKWWRWAALAALVLGALLRLPRLDLRPMHTDEAVHALKFGTLLETGVYRYDRNEYHGPTLNYLTLLPAWMAGQKTLAEVSEKTLRVVPALAGIGLVLLILSLRKTGEAASAFAGLLAACSPMMSYYSRYYIQETLLVFFAMGLLVAVCRFLATGRMGWAAAAGVSAGLMAATKETWVISIGAMVASLLAAVLTRRRQRADRIRVGAGGVVVGAATAVAVAVLFFSSFFSNWEGVFDSVLAYETYVSRAGEESRHGHPWHYFLQMLVWWNKSPGPAWTEGSIVFFAIVGIIGSFFGREGLTRTPFGPATTQDPPAGAAEAGSSHDGRARSTAPPPGGRAERDLTPELRIFLATYACLMLPIISVFPYKTPWLALGALLSLVLMAGWGVAGFLAWLPKRLKLPGYLLLAVLGGHLLWQSYLANFEYYDDPSNPMVYSHPNDDVRQIAGILERVVLAAPDSPAIQVVVSGDEYWPLPWYVRRLPRIGWWGAITEEFSPTPVILVSPDRERDLLARLYETPPPGERPLYVPLFDRPMYLRPGREIRGYVKLELSNRMRAGTG